MARVAYPNSWDALKAAGKAFNAKDENSYPLVLDYIESLTLLHSYMVQKYNISAIDDKAGKFTYTPAQWEKFFQRYKDLVDSHVFPSMRVLASYGKANTWEMKPWISGQWGGIYMWNTNATMYEANLQLLYNKLDLGPFFMLPGAKEAGLFFKPTMMLSIGRSTKHPEEAALLVNFLMNEAAGVKVMGLERGVTLIVEGLNRYEAEHLNSAEDMVQFLDLIGSPSQVGILWGVFHGNIEDSDFAPAIALMGSRLRHVHFADSNRAFPGDGHLPFDDIYRQLKQSHYQGAISRECLCRRSAQTVIDESGPFIQRLRQLSRT